MTNLASIITLIITYRNNDFTFRTAKTSHSEKIPGKGMTEWYSMIQSDQWYSMIHWYTSIEMRPGMTIRRALDTKHQGWFSRLISSCLCKEHLHLDPVHLLSQLDVVQGRLQAVLQAVLSDPQYTGVRWWTVMDGDGWWWMVWQTSLFHGGMPYSIQFDSSICIEILATSLCSSPFAATTSRFSWGPPAFWCLIAVGPQWCISKWLLLQEERGDLWAKLWRRVSQSASGPVLDEHMSKSLCEAGKQPPLPPPPWSTAKGLLLPGHTSASAHTMMSQSLLKNVAPSQSWKEWRPIHMLGRRRQ